LGGGSGCCRYRCVSKRGKALPPPTGSDRRGNATCSPCQAHWPARRDRGDTPIHAPTVARAPGCQTSGTKSSATRGSSPEVLARCLAVRPRWRRAECAHASRLSRSRGSAAPRLRRSSAPPLLGSAAPRLRRSSAPPLLGSAAPRLRQGGGCSRAPFALGAAGRPRVRPTRTAADEPVHGRGPCRLGGSPRRPVTPCRGTPWILSAILSDHSPPDRRCLHPAGVTRCLAPTNGGIVWHARAICRVSVRCCELTVRFAGTQP